MNKNKTTDQIISNTQSMPKKAIGNYGGGGEDLHDP